MNPHKTLWTEADYPEMSWHDNHVHGLSILSGPDGAGELVLDFDHILEWLPHEDGCNFLIAPATLRFREVTDLRIVLDYVTTPAALTPFSIGSIEREEQVAPNGYRSFHWNIGVNWPEGLITFTAAGFRQTVRGEPILTSEQFLTVAERSGPGGVQERPI